MKGVHDEIASTLKPPPAGPSMPSGPSTAACEQDAGLASLLPAHIVVFEIMHAHGRPLTLRQIVRLTSLPQAEVQMVLEALHDHGLVRRLETVIVSYVTAQ